MPRLPAGDGRTPSQGSFSLVRLEREATPLPGPARAVSCQGVMDEDEDASTLHSATSWSAWVIGYTVARNHEEMQTRSDRIVICMITH